MLGEAAADVTAATWADYDSDGDVDILVVGDVGVNASMTPETLAHCAVGTCAVARDLFPDTVLPVINGAMVSYSNKGSDEGPSPELVRRATALVPEILAERIKRGRRYDTIRVEGEGKAAPLEPPHGAVRAPGPLREDDDTGALADALRRPFLVAFQNFLFLSVAIQAAGKRIDALQPLIDLGRRFAQAIFQHRVASLADGRGNSPPVVQRLLNLGL